MARIIGVNGIHNWSWSNNSFTDKFLAILNQEHQVVDVRYPKMLAVLGYVPGAISRRAKQIAEANISPDDIVVAHSFGCLATIVAMREYGAKFDKVIFFAAAAEADIEIPQNFNILYNIHSDGDFALTLGKLLPFHKFGALGQDGHLGTNPKVVNVFAPGYNHNDYVDPKNICNWVDVIRKIIDGRFWKADVPLNRKDGPRYDAGVNNRFGQG
jgi:hypothetical protein